MTTLAKIRLNDVTPGVRVNLREVFADAFPNDSWRSSFPHQDDLLYIVKAVDGKKEGPVLGFCAVHDPPYRFRQESKDRQTYVYNLCVRSSARRKGVGTQLIEAVRSDTPNFCMHTHYNNPHRAWFVHRNMRVIGKWREIYVEFVSWAERPKDVEAPNLRHYDPVEGLIYLD